MSWKNKLDKKTQQLLLIILFPLLTLSIAFAFYYKSPINFLQPKEYKLYIYDDRTNKGNSVGTLINYDSNYISYQYTLHDGITYPYAGLGFGTKAGSFIDLSSYDYVKIKLKASKGKRMYFTLGTYIDNYSKDEDFMSHRLMHSMVHAGPELEENILAINKFTTPDWWLNINKKTENQIQAPDFSRTKFFNLNQCIDIEKNVEDKVVVQELSFHKDYLPFFLYSGLFMVLYYSITIGISVLNKNRKVEINPSVHFNYEKLDVVNHYAKEEEAIFNFLASSYVHQDLSITDLQNELGLHEQKISSIIKKKSGLSFKQFLNKLRLSEAQRLLLQTDLQVSEIAFKVGYGNVSHFNRVFKESLKCSPNDFRKQQAII